MVKPKCPIHLAASENFNTKKLRPKMIPIIENLLRGGASPFEIYDNDVPILHDLCEHCEIIEPVLKIPGVDLETRDRHGRTLFLAACSHSQLNRAFPHEEAEAWGSKSRSTCATELSEYGVDIEAADERAQNALHHLLSACSPSFNPSWGASRNFEFLTSSPSAATLIAQSDRDGMTALLHATENATFVFCDALLDQGADPLATTQDGNTVLHLLAQHVSSHIKAVSMFQRFLHLHVPINARTKRGETPLFLYLRSSGAKVADAPWFLKAGADPFATSGTGQGLLHVVAEKQEFRSDFLMQEKDLRLEIFKSLMEQGLDATREDDQRRTPLDLALWRLGM